MKKIILGLCLIMIGVFAHAQQGLENIVVEKYYVSDAADAAGSSGTLPVGSVTYRVWADMLPGYNFQALYGVSNHTMTVQTSTTFFNNEDYGTASAPITSATNIRKNSALLDSYFSVGGVANGRVGVFKSEDTDNSPGNAQSILQNNDVTATGPINIGSTLNAGAQDGMIVGTPASVTFVGISTTDLAPFADISQVGGFFTTNNGSVAALGGATGPTSANRVLVGQFTTDGCFAFELNVQIGTPTGGVQKYVSRNPVANEILFAPCLYNTATATIAPTVSPICAGQTVTFQATTNYAGVTPTYQWIKNGSNDGTNSASYTTAVVAGDQISLTVTSSLGCVFGSPATSNTITIYAPATAANVSGCMGTTIALAGSPFGGTYSIPNPYSGPTSTTYTYSYVDPNGCSTTSSSATVTVNPLPVVTANNVSGCVGAPITLTGTPAGGSWTQSNPYSGSATSYQHIFTDGNGCTNTSATATITRFALPTTAISGTATFCQGGSSVLNSNATAGSGNISGYQWKLATVAISGETNATYTATASGSYTVTVTNDNGCSKTSVAFVVTANPLPTVTAGNVSGCTGSAIALSGTPAGGTFSVANPYTGPSTTYTYSYTDGNGCSNTSAPATITVNPPPTVSFPLAASYGYNETVTLVGSPAGGTFTGPGVSGNTFTPAIAGVGGPYSIAYIYTDGNGCTNSVAHQTSVIAAYTGPCSGSSPYVVPLATGTTTTSILTTPDVIGGYEMEGIPDGLGAFDNNDGTFTLLMNHEFGNTVGATRAHGSIGSFVSKWIINKTTLCPASGMDLMQNVNLWNGSGYTTYNSGNPSSLAAFSRFCAGDLPAVSAFYNSASGNGTTERIYMNGEESGTEGRAVGHIVTGANAGTSYQLPWLGKMAFENAVARPYSGDKTVVGETDDGTGGQVYFYIGTKTNSGNEIQKAGLTNGNLYGVIISGFPVERVNSTTINPPPSAGTTFTLSNFGQVQNTSGATLNTNSISAGVTTFSRPEDGSWDPNHPDDFYFVTTDQYDQAGDGVGTQVGRSRLWKLHFTNIATPEAGGTITALLDGTEGQNMLDNIGFDNYGHILMQEDVGNQQHNGKIWQYTVATDVLTLIAKHDESRFGNIGVAATAPFNQDEESSGILDMQSILGPGMFIFDDQAHYAIAGAAVEGGQLLTMFNPDTYNASTCATTSSTTANGCVNYTWNGTTYTNSGTFVYHTLNAAGCDSAATLVLTINPLPVVTASNVCGCAGSAIALSGSPAGGTFSVANPYTGPSTTYTYSYTDGNGCSATSSSATITVNPLPVVTAGNVSGCAGSAIALSGSPAGGTFSVANPYTGPSTTYTYSYTDGSGCSATSAAANITVNPLPTVSFTGLATTYNVGAAAATLTGSPAGGTFSGPGISGNTFDPSVAGVGGPYTITYSYTDGNGCSNSVTHQTTVTNCSVPGQPGTISIISGPTKVCPGSNVIYKIAIVAGATSYTWTVPTGVVINSGQGTRKLNVTYTAGFTASGTLSVVANNACGTGPARTLIIYRNNPEVPGVITGITYGACNAVGVPYSVVNAAGITYNWAWNVGTATVASGQGSNSITANFSGSFTQGYLGISATNACGTSATRYVQVKAVPNQPGAITGATSVCANQPGVPYSIVAVPSAVTYVWTGPSGSHVSDGLTTSPGAVLSTTSNSVTVNFGAVAGNLNVRAVNACGSGINRTLLVYTTCREGISESLFDVNVYPNPSIGDFTISVQNGLNEKTSITVMDAAGRMVQNMISTTSDSQIQISNLVPGVYSAVVTNGENRKVLKLIKVN